jgi:hypothetical protein
MRSHGSFDGLQFRIMETLEKQPGGAPLTALEIASILHGAEFKNEPMDNLIFKVTRATVGMANTGKLAIADAKDKDGRRCYQLPTRMKFPPAPADAKPANPVLTPEVAAEIKTVEPKPAPKRAPIYVVGIYDKILTALDEASHPLTTRDLVNQLGPLYGTRYDKTGLRTLFSGHLNYLVKTKRKVFRRKVTGYGAGIQFEHYTRKTGTAPHPLAPKATKEQVQQDNLATAEGLRASHTVAAPLPSQAWSEPKHVAPKATGGGFRPQRVELNEVTLNFRVPATWNNRLVAAAKLANLSISDFMRQAVDYAIDNLEAE